MNVEPYGGFADDLPPPASIFVLGAAHRRCLRVAIRRLRNGELVLPEVLPQATIDQPPVHEMELDNLGLPPTEHTCAYCDTRSTSDEHVFPIWVSNVLGGRAGFVIHNGGRPRHRKRIPVTTNRVCSTCNNGWLSVLENDCKSIIEPMLLGRNRALAEVDQERVAAWGYKTALMLDMVGEGAVPLGYFRTFANNRTPPDSAIIWIGAYVGDSAVMAYQNPLRAGAPADELPLALVSTFSIGRLLFQVFQHFTRTAADVRDDRAAAVVLDRIWPAQPAFSWPRQHVGFGDDSLRELAGSINSNHE